MVRLLAAAAVVLVATMVAPAGAGAAGVQQISAGTWHTCAIKTDGTPICWGQAYWGQLRIPPGTGSVTAIEAGTLHTCAIRSDGTPTCWGDNVYGRATVPVGTGRVSAVSAGQEHTCVIKLDGDPVCWGGNWNGQTTIPPGTGRVTAISAGSYHTCAIKTDGTPVCWGANWYGQATVPDGVGTVSAIAAGEGHTCAIRTDGTPVCWGRDDRGHTRIPRRTGSVTAIVIANGSYQSHHNSHTCAIKTDGTLVCWGDNHHGQTTIPLTLGPVVAVTAGGWHTCAIKTDSTPVCWGDNEDGQLGAPVVPSPAPRGALISQPYRHEFTSFAGPRGRFAVTAGALPPGLELSRDGVLSGTPTTVGAYTFTVTADNELFEPPASREFTIAVVGAPAAVPAPRPPGARVAVPYRHVFTSSTGIPRGAFAVTAGALPPGLGLSAAGVLSGTPTAPGTFTFTVTADNELFPPAGREFSLRVARARITGLPVADNPSVIVVGRPQPGRTLISTTGSWSGKPTEFAYRWERCDADGQACAPIAGATGKSIVLGAGDVGHRLRAKVLATNAEGTALRPATGHPSMTVASERASQPTLPFRRPLIGGVLQAGRTLAVAAGRWRGDPALSVQWRRCELDGRGCIDIPGATATSFVLSGADVAHRLRVVVTATTTAGPVAYQTHPTAPIGAPVG